MGVVSIFLMSYLIWVNCDFYIEIIQELGLDLFCCIKQTNRWLHHHCTILCKPEPPAAGTAGTYCSVSQEGKQVRCVVLSMSATCSIIHRRWLQLHWILLCQPGRSSHRRWLQLQWILSCLSHLYYPLHRRNDDLKLEWAEMYSKVEMYLSLSI